jgi:hypothetical protein
MAVRQVFKMSRVRDRRIARLGARLNEAAAAEIRERCRLRAIAVISAAVRCALESAGIDPARAASLCEAEIAEAALPDTAELQRAEGDDAAHRPAEDDDVLDGFLAETRRRASSYEADGAIDLATAPLADLFAWCLARGSITLQQASSENLLLMCCKP